jgi:hypothetical protein
MNWLGNLYSWLWFHIEFALTPIDRRPFTFIMRDWIYTHIPLFAILVFLFYAGMIILSIWHGTASTIIASLCSFVLAHLVWGTKYIESEQEYPTYNPRGEI